MTSFCDQLKALRENAEQIQSKSQWETVAWFLVDRVVEIEAVVRTAEELCSVTKPGSRSYLTDALVALNKETP